MIAARCFEALIFDMQNMLLQVLAVYLASWSDPVKYLDNDQALRGVIETVQLLGIGRTNNFMCSWKRRDARLVLNVARFTCHMYPASSSQRGG